MGVKTTITLQEANELFASYEFSKLTPTTSGIIDTTYIISNNTKSYILKKYERAISEDIKRDIKLLDELSSLKLNVPRCIDERKGWYLYEKLEGCEPKNIRTYHIRALAEFLARLHGHTYKRCTHPKLIDKSEIDSLLKYVKQHFFFYYKKLSSLKKYDPKECGLIHGDLFKDNTVFEGKKLGVFDFIDSGCGEFAFDAAVALIGFDVKRHNTFFINLFLNTYNQKAHKKLKRSELLLSIEQASMFYALKRINNHKNTAKAKELISPVYGLL